MYVRMCVCMYIHTYIRTYVCVYVRMYIHTYICTYVCVYVYTYIQYIRVHTLVFDVVEIHGYALIALNGSIVMLSMSRSTVDINCTITIYCATT